MNVSCRHVHESWWCLTLEWQTWSNDHLRLVERNYYGDCDLCVEFPDEVRHWPIVFVSVKDEQESGWMSFQLGFEYYYFVELPLYCTRSGTSVTTWKELYYVWRLIWANDVMRDLTPYVRAVLCFASLDNQLDSVLFYVRTAGFCLGNHRQWQVVSILL